MIVVVVQQWANEAAAVLESIDYEMFQVHVIEAMHFVPQVNQLLEDSAFGDARLALLDGSVTLEPGCLQALDEALYAHPTVGVASAYTDGEAFAGEVNPHCCLFREGVLEQMHGLNARLRCYAWERGIADRLRPWEWRTSHVADALTTSLYDTERMAALGPHYYDQLADDEIARAGGQT